MSDPAATTFFSYSREDSEFVLRLAKDMRAAGAKVWLDQLDISPGQRWDSAVEAALRASPRQIAVLSPAAVSSDNVMDEISFALEEHKQVIPVLLHDCRIPFRLRRVQHIDFRTDYDHGLRELLKALGVEEQPEPPKVAHQQGGRPSQSENTDETPLAGKAHERENREIAQSAAEHLALEKAKAEQLATKKAADAERLDTQKKEAERKTQERAEEQRFARERAEIERQAAEEVDRDRLGREKAEAVREAQEKVEQERLKRERPEATRIQQIAKERAESERLAIAKARQDRPASEGAEAKRFVEWPPKSKIWTVILTTSVGMMIEWYDFYVFGVFAVILAVKFYPPGNSTFALIAYLSTFAIGFMVRPFGALLFGRIGDLAGRKRAFMITVTIMGGCTFLIGLMPTFATAGWFAPIGLIAIRMLQGLAMGGAYGGAAVHVGEHCPDGKRGFYTSFIQITATLGLFFALITVLATQYYMDPYNFSRYGWRIPFLISIILVAISLYILLKIKESPIFEEIKSTGMTSAQPLKDAFSHWANLKLVLISLFGATAGQGVVWYTSQYYALFYLQAILRIKLQTGFVIVAIAMLLGMPFFTVFGSLSDRIGRKKIILAGCLLAAISYYPIYGAMETAVGNHVETLKSTQNPLTGQWILTPLTRDADNQLVPARIAVDPNVPMLVLLVFIQVIFVTMVYGPIAAYLVESFPAKIRYSSLSLPYHIGNGVFGGLVPIVGLSICARTGNIYAGLWYPMTVAAVTFIVGSIFLKDTSHIRIWGEVSTNPATGD